MDKQKANGYEYTRGIAYVIAYRRKRTVEQIAKFFGVSINAVKASLKARGVLSKPRISARDKKLQKLEKQIRVLNDRLNTERAKGGDNGKDKYESDKNIGTGKGDYKNCGNADTAGITISYL